MPTWHRRAIAIACGLMIGGPVKGATCWAADPVPAVHWTGADSKGASLQVPSAERTTVLLFLRAEQTQSEDAISQVRTLLASDKSAPQVMVVVSGDAAKESAREFATRENWSWPVVIDADHALAGQMGVHAWPTTLVVARDGRQVGRVAGMSDAYSRSLEAYLEFAAGKLDEAALNARLEGNAVVVDSAAQMSSRHLKVAQRLLDRGLIEQARIELAAAQTPEDAAGRLALADALLAVGQPAEALRAIDGLVSEKGPAWQVGVLRGRALVALERWDEARPILIDAIKNSPAPAEARYALGRVYQHAGEWERAAECFRMAFEATAEGRHSAAAATQPSTQPTGR